LSEADRIAQQRLREQLDAQRARARREQAELDAYRSGVLAGIRVEVQQVLPLLAASGYPGLEPLTFTKLTFFGKEKEEVKAGWRLGTFWMPETNRRGEGHEPLHLLDDGSFAAFGHSRFELSELDEDVWWGRKAPETILRGLQELRARLEQGRRRG
jgi:hypothetical protein